MLSSATAATTRIPRSRSLKRTVVPARRTAPAPAAASSPAATAHQGARPTTRTLRAEGFQRRWIRKRGVLRIRRVTSIAKNCASHKPVSATYPHLRPMDGRLPRPRARPCRAGALPRRRARRGGGRRRRPRAPRWPCQGRDSAGQRNEQGHGRPSNRGDQPRRPRGPPGGRAARRPTPTAAGRGPRRRAPPCLPGRASRARPGRRLDSDALVRSPRKP